MRAKSKARDYSLKPSWDLPHRPAPEELEAGGEAGRQAGEDWIKEYRDINFLSQLYLFFSIPSSPARRTETPRPTK